MDVNFNFDRRTDEEVDEKIAFGYNQFFYNESKKINAKYAERMKKRYQRYLYTTDEPLDYAEWLKNRKVSNFFRIAKMVIKTQKYV